jgi:hypothetical protein
MLAMCTVELIIFVSRSWVQPKKRKNITVAEFLINFISQPPKNTPPKINGCMLVVGHSARHIIRADSCYRDDAKLNRRGALCVCACWCHAMSVIKSAANRELLC